MKVSVKTRPPSRVVVLFIVSGLSPDSVSTNICNLLMKHATVPIGGNTSRQKWLIKTTHYSNNTNKIFTKCKYVFI
jgi:hypothetical protein